MGIITYSDITKVHIASDGSFQMVTVANVAAMELNFRLIQEWEERENVALDRKLSSW